MPVGRSGRAALRPANPEAPSARPHDSGRPQRAADHQGGLSDTRGAPRRSRGRGWAFQGRLIGGPGLALAGILFGGAGHRRASIAAPITVRIRLIGVGYAGAILAALDRGAIDLREAGEYLDVGPASFEPLAQRVKETIERYG